MHKLAKVADGYHSKTMLAHVERYAWDFIDQIGYTEAKIAGKGLGDAARNEANTPGVRVDAVYHLGRAIIEATDKIKRARTDGDEDIERAAVRHLEGMFDGAGGGEEVARVVKEVITVTATKSGDAQRRLISRTLRLHNDLLEAIKSLRAMQRGLDPGSPPKRPRFGKEHEAEVQRILKEHSGDE